jgi:hypothetical protein
MVTGYNESVKHHGKTYHVQTEDRGRKNPIIETLIYVGGKIIHREVSSYADQNEDHKYDEKVIKILLDQQHDKTKEEIQAGRFEEFRPFGEEFISNRSFEQVILDFLAEEEKARTLSLDVVSKSAFAPSGPAFVLVRASDKESGQPIAGVKVHAKLLRTTGGPVDLPNAKSDAKGEARVEFEVPEGGGSLALRVWAESAAGRDEVQLLVR